MVALGIIFCSMSLFEDVACPPLAHQEEQTSFLFVRGSSPRWRPIVGLAQLEFGSFLVVLPIIKSNVQSLFGELHSATDFHYITANLFLIKRGQKMQPPFLGWENNRICYSFGE